MALALVGSVFVNIPESINPKYVIPVFEIAARPAAFSVKSLYAVVLQLEGAIPVSPYRVREMFEARS